MWCFWGRRIGVARFGYVKVEFAGVFERDRTTAMWMDFLMCRWSPFPLRCGDLRGGQQRVHGLGEGLALYEHEIVDGIAVDAAGRPSPVAAFDQQVVMFGNEQVACGDRFEGEALVLEQGSERSLSGGNGVKEAMGARF